MSFNEQVFSMAAFPTIMFNVGEDDGTKHVMNEERAEVFLAGQPLMSTMKVLT